MSHDASSGEPESGDHEGGSPVAQLSGDRKGAKNAGDFAAGLVIFLIALYTGYESIRMPFYGDSGVWGSPGLTPGLISAVLLGLSALLMFRARRFAWANVGVSISPVMRRGMGVLALILAYVAAIPHAGYVPATFVMLFAFQLIYARSRNFTYLAVWVFGLSVILTAVLYYVFAELFLIPMPKGPLGV
jgi:hypothetical protein